VNVSTANSYTDEQSAWRIVYRYDDKCVYVMAVLDARRDLAGILLERLTR